MRYLPLFKEAVRSGSIAALAMMPFGLLLRFLGLRVGYYGPKFAGLLLAAPTQFVLIVQHFVIGWISALPLLFILVRAKGCAAPTAIGAAYGVGYYVLVNSLALPLLFGDPLPWLLGFRFIYPSLMIHVVFGVSVAITAKRFVARAGKRG